MYMTEKCPSCGEQLRQIQVEYGTVYVCSGCGWQSMSEVIEDTDYDIEEQNGHESDFMCTECGYMLTERKNEGEEECYYECNRCKWKGDLNTVIELQCGHYFEEEWSYNASDGEDWGEVFDKE